MNIPKYRAYHKQLKKLQQVLEIDLDPESGGVYVEGESNYLCACLRGKIFWPWHDIELMQCIPQKDESDKDIYEGDILKIQDTTATVVFRERPPEFGLDCHDEEQWCEDWNLTDDSYRMSEIGNTWEQ